MGRLALDVHLSVVTAYNQMLVLTSTGTVLEHVAMAIWELNATPVSSHLKFKNFM